MVRRSYRQFCSASRMLDVVGERWTLLIVRDLAVGPLRWSELHEGLPGLGPTLLSDRLRDLTAAGIVQPRSVEGDGRGTVYELTDAGRDLEPVVNALARAGIGLLDRPTDDEPARARLLLAGLKGFLVPEALDERELVVHLDLDELDATCEIGPRRDEAGRLVPFHRRVTIRAGTPDRADVVVHGTAWTILRVRQGRLPPGDAGAGRVRIDGPADATTLVRELLGL